MYSMDSSTFKQETSIKVGDIIQSQEEDHEFNDHDISSDDDIWNDVFEEELERQMKLTEENDPQYDLLLTATKKSKFQAKQKQPKRKRTAYLFYTSSMRGKVSSENQGLLPAEITKILATQWKNLSDEEKAPYFQKALEDQNRWETEKVDYLKRYNPSPSSISVDGQPSNTQNKKKRRKKQESDETKVLSGNLHTVTLSELATADSHGDHGTHKRLSTKTQTSTANETLPGHLEPSKKDLLPPEKLLDERFHSAPPWPLFHPIPADGSQPLTHMIPYISMINPFNPEIAEEQRLRESQFYEHMKPYVAPYYFVPDQKYFANPMGLIPTPPFNHGVTYLEGLCSPVNANQYIQTNVRSSSTEEKKTTASSTNNAKESKSTNRMGVENLTVRPDSPKS